MARFLTVCFVVLGPKIETLDNRHRPCMAESKKYNHTEQNHNLKSPNIILPVIYDVLKPRSVADIGCGTGTFLHAFKKLGVEKVVGVDGPWADKDLLYSNIDKSEFVEADLEKPIDLKQKFDLVVCLEVAEHLAGNSADIVAKNLVSHSDTILFSAAVPGQGGQNHINEQWTAYWREKFAKHDYVFHDVLRSIFWNNKDVFWWYKQNIFLVTHKSQSHKADLFKAYGKSDVFDYVHPELLQEKVEWIDKLETGHGTTRLYLKILGRYSKRIIRKVIPI